MHFFTRLLALFVFLSSGLTAAPKISGKCGYEFLNGSGKVSIGVDKITNSGTGATGTLLVQLWALSAPYQGGRISGHVLGSYKLDPLKPGNLYSLPNKVVACTLPATRKEYSICVTVSDYSGGQFVIADYSNFTSKLTLGTPPKLFTMEGPTHWQTDYANNKLDISVAKISHTRTSCTGTLRLAVWATARPYNGGGISGHQIGYAQKKALDPGYSYTDLKSRVELSPPPQGSYYVTIALMEFDGKAYNIVAWNTNKNPSSFPAATVR